jgi:hypothetical protein
MDYGNHAENNRRRLNDICKRARYTNISFTIAPDRCPTFDCLVAEAADALERFYEEKKSGRLVPDDEERC